MEVLEYLDASASTRTIVEMGDNPHGQAIAKHLKEDHGLGPVTAKGFENIQWYTLMDDHRAALVEGEIKLEDL